MQSSGITCLKCLLHFRKIIEINKIENNYNSKNELINYFIKIHNIVNKSKKKKEMSRIEVDKIYFNFDDSELKNHKLDIKKLFAENKVYEFPNIINSTTKKLLII